MNTLLSSVTMIVTLTLTIIAITLLAIGTWKTLTYITNPIAIWIANIGFFGDDEKYDLISAQIGVATVGMFICLFTAMLEVNLLERSHGEFWVAFENHVATALVNMAIAGVKGVVEGIVVMGSLGAVVMGLGLGKGEGREKKAA